jgi:hypothetical protein
MPAINQGSPPRLPKNVSAKRSRVLRPPAKFRIHVVKGTLHFGLRLEFRESPKHSAHAGEVTHRPKTIQGAPFRCAAGRFGAVSRK